MLVNDPIAEDADTNCLCACKNDRVTVKSVEKEPSYKDLPVIRN